MKLLFVSPNSNSAWNTARGRFASGELQLTILDEKPLTKRLKIELAFLLKRLRREWPLFRSDPSAYLIAAINAAIELARRDLRIRMMLPGIILVVAVVLLFATPSNRTTSRQEVSTFETVEVFELANLSLPSERSGVGVGTRGRVGLNDGRGEGSEREPKASHGGGGGGNGNQHPTQHGRVPLPSVIPAPIPAQPMAMNRALPMAGVDIDPALWKNQPLPVFGDPRSSSNFTSNGPGRDGGMGDGSGTGIGEGSGPGVGPGEEGGIGGGSKSPGGGQIGGGRGNNPEDPNHVWPATQVSRRARVIAKPEPQYTEEARRNQTTGTVVLRVVFTHKGDVANIRAINSLPFGLTERAIAAARQIRFVPAMRGGRAVSVHMQLEYNFNLY